MKNLIELDSDYAETLSTVNQMGFYAIQILISHPALEFAEKQNNTIFYKELNNHSGWKAVLCAMPFGNTMLYKIITKKHIFDRIEKISECWVVDDTYDTLITFYPTNARFFDHTQDIWQYFNIPI